MIFLLLWLFGPAILLISVAVTMPETLVSWRMSCSKPMLLGMVAVFLLLLSCVLFVPSFYWYDALFGIVAFGFPFLFTGVSILLFAALSDPQRIYWGQVGASGALFSVLCWGVYYTSETGRLASLLAVALTLSGLATTVVGSLWFGWRLAGRRKVAALIMLIVVSSTLILSFYVGGSQSFEEITARNGTVIVEALDRFYQQRGTYPESLSELVPETIDQLPEAVTTQGTGWLYTSTDDTFILGYWDWPDKDCVMLYTYSSLQPGWKSEVACGWEEWGPFEPVMTPTPVLP